MATAFAVTLKNEFLSSKPPKTPPKAAAPAVKSVTDPLRCVKTKSPPVDAAQAVIYDPEPLKYPSIEPFFRSYTKPPAYSQTRTLERPGKKQAA